jgi:DNA modification methylase
MLNNIVCGDAFELSQKLEDNSINLLITSPPYAMQRSKLYKSISEEEYPSWMVKTFSPLWTKLKDNASMLIVIRANIKDGQISDYVLKTRLALREFGWKETEEYIWYKPDAPPLGSLYRPRRTWENILCFGKTTKPYMDLKACGNETKRIGFAGSQRFGLGGDSPISSNQNTEMKDGVSRVSDVFRAHIGEIEKNIQHPAMFPITLVYTLIKTFSKEGDVVLDPFCGSGTTCLGAKQLNRQYIGFDIQQEYVDIAKKRLSELF